MRLVALPKSVTALFTTHMHLQATATLRYPAHKFEPVCLNIAQDLRLLPTLSLVYLAVSESVSLSSCVFSGQVCVFVMSINKRLLSL